MKKVIKAILQRLILPFSLLSITMFINNIPLLNDTLPQLLYPNIEVNIEEKQLNIWQELTLGQKVDLTPKSIKQILHLLFKIITI